MISIMFVAVAFFVSGLFARELLNIAITEWKQEKESIKKAHDFSRVTGEKIGQR